MRASDGAEFAEERVREEVRWAAGRTPVETTALAENILFFSAVAGADEGLGGVSFGGIES